MKRVVVSFMMCVVMMDTSLLCIREGRRDGKYRERGEERLYTVPYVSI